MPRPLTLANKRVGEKNKNKQGVTFEIIAVSENRTKGGNAKFIIKSLASGYETEVEYSNFQKGQFKDYGSPTVFGVGYSYKGSKSEGRIYKMWSHMIERCYSEKATGYERYGAAGVKVCDRWMFFEKFEQDIKNLKNYKRFINNPNLYSLDKDIIGDGKLYSSKTCMFANHIEQSHAQERVKKIKSISPNGEIRIHDSITSACKNLGVQNANLYKVLNGERTHTKGYRFERL